jgi:hypothetical protein
MGNNFLDQETLEDRVRYWQQRLRLQDWAVEIVMERAYDLGDYWGKIHVAEDKRRARIRIMDPIDLSPAAIAPYDMDQIIVHELLHIHLYPITKAEDSMPEEQAIEAISWALVGLDRRADEIENHYMRELDRRPYGFLPVNVQAHILYAGKGEQGPYE